MTMPDLESPPSSGSEILAPAELAAKTLSNRSPRWRSNHVLGIAWLHGLFQLAVFHRQTAARTWASDKSVNTLEEFEAALDAGLAALEFSGTEVFLLLEHDQFLHQAELAPAFSDSAARNVLRSRVIRHETEHEPVLWVSQRTVSVRKEAAFLLHLLPASFYGRLNGLLHARRLDLTRILPLMVPLQLTRDTDAALKDQPVLLVAEAGKATTVVVSRGDGQLLFTRTMLARWETDSARIGVEVNRSLLYAKQQFSLVVEHVRLLGGASEAARAEVQAKCGAGKDVQVLSTSPLDWLQAVVKLSARHPVNLVAGHLGRKRRHQFYRRVLLAGCWLGLSLLALEAWTRQRETNEDEHRLASLRAHESEMQTEREHLKVRNAEVARNQELIRETVDEKLPDVAPRFLLFLGTVRPADLQFSEITIKCDSATGKWSFRLEGQIDGDEETARETLAAFQKTLAKSPLRAGFNEGMRSLAGVSNGKSEVATAQRFAVEGGLFEN